MSSPLTYQLSDLMSDLQLVIRSSFDHTYWVIAELANVSGSPKGHMYFELVEKNEQQIVAKARANLWSSRRHQIIHMFEEVTRQTLKAGMKVLLQLQVDFHLVYGLSFQILDIDPAYSLGELEKQRQETIQRLKEEGLLEFNKQYVLPQVLQNLAIISSESAAGYQDFLNQLENNALAYKFKTTLFPAIMQGDKAPESISSALGKIEDKNEEFDAIILIRGGGSNLDLACFDDYALNARLAQAYFPVFSGIGHERDTSVTDMIAHTRLKTPTAVAEYIVQHNERFEIEVSDLFRDIIEFSREIISEGKEEIRELSFEINQSTQQAINKDNTFLREISYLLNNQSIRKINDNQNQLLHHKREFQMLSKELFFKGEYHLNNQLKSLSDKCDQLFKKEKDTLILDKDLSRRALNFLEKTINQLEYFDQFIQLSDPKTILKKGFSISRIEGKAITNSEDVQMGQILESQLYQGVIKSKIYKDKNNG
mgnify:CR=1 FL=1